jgi:hypothetical protein
MGYLRGGEPAEVVVVVDGVDRRVPVLPAPLAPREMEPRVTVTQDVELLVEQVDRCRAQVDADPILPGGALAASAILSSHEMCVVV